jgi:hypothetical protein
MNGLLVDIRPGIRLPPAPPWQRATDELFEDDACAVDVDGAHGGIGYQTNARAFVNNAGEESREGEGASREGDVRFRHAVAGPPVPKRHARALHHG